MPFSVSDFLPFIMLCKADEAGTDFLITCFTFILNFRNFKEWITFRNEILDVSLSRDLRDFTANSLNGDGDLKCTSFFTLLTLLNMCY